MIQWVKSRRETCLDNVKRPPVKAENFGDLHKAVTETQHRMGIAQPNGNAFRLNGGKRQRQTTSGAMVRSKVRSKTAHSTCILPDRYCEFAVISKRELLIRKMVERPDISGLGAIRSQ
jgi:hypothetical protein